MTHNIVANGVPTWCLTRCPAGHFKSPAATAGEELHISSEHQRAPVSTSSQYSAGVSSAENEDIKRPAGDGSAPEGFPQQVPGGNMQFPHPFHTMPYGGFSYGYQYMPVRSYLASAQYFATVLLAFNFTVSFDLAS